MQEVVELVVFALIALLVGTGLVWVSGWLLGLVGTLLTWLAGLVWSLLRFLVPVAIVAGVVYLLVQFLTRSGEKVARGPQEQPPTPPSPWTMSAEPQDTSQPQEATESETVSPADEDAEGASDQVAEGADAKGADADGPTERSASEDEEGATEQDAEEDDGRKRDDAST